MLWMVSSSSILGVQYQGLLRKWSVCAHTHRASLEDKDKFFDDLQSVVDGISEDQLLLIVGDFNARVDCGHEKQLSTLTHFV